MKENSSLMPVLRLLALVASLPLLYWAGSVLSNFSIFGGYQDSYWAVYVVFAAIPGVPGLLLLAFAIFGRLWPRRAAHEPAATAH